MEQCLGWGKLAPEKSVRPQGTHLCCCSAPASVWLFATPWTVARQASLSFTISRSLLNSGPLSWWCYQSSHLLLPSSFAFSLSQCQGFSGELVLHIRWPKYCSFNFNISSSNEYSGLISFRIDWLDLLAVFSSTTILKHQFFGTQPSLWSNSHICIWLLERLWLYWPLSAKGCFCFLICSLGLSQLSFQGASIFYWGELIPPPTNKFNNQVKVVLTAVMPTLFIYRSLFPMCTPSLPSNLSQNSLQILPLPL